ncbi:glycosyl hydrolase 2 galactose-binding domain-containing protein [Sphingomonas sp. BAUL-RG-20F-R05-02]|uniref:glycosyl hydrolase 2 galactose-binding domain-containing protein n=1 Tax=Sphingomonas sp. BAUL-RG-20F-R05-02 TaxID=2914830 RepID=UPI001F567052|nr:sugar-binding domain-containing protein [Sphingomonas sp. BAUL-RG-20F-R05-02]
MTIIGGRRRISLIAALITCAMPIYGLEAADLAQPSIVDGRGPYNLAILQGGVGATYPLTASAAKAASEGNFSISGSISPDSLSSDFAPLVVIGDPAGACRSLGLENGHLVFRSGNASLRATAAIAAGQWTAIALVADGRRVSLFVGGRMMASRVMSVEGVAPNVAIAPVVPGQAHFGGKIAGLTILPSVLTAADLAATAGRKPDAELTPFIRPGQGWEWQERQWRGMFQPQDPATLPTGKTGPSAPVVVPAVDTAPLTKLADGHWRLGGWKLGIGPDVKANAATISANAFDSSKWFDATVPGTVLTTLVDRGVYPDPSYGLNNMAIPEQLARQDYWYRTNFDIPAGSASTHRRLLLKGINYAAEVWVNGKNVGSVTGAFIRGDFDVSALLQPGRNTVAVHILPPPHPGIPHEESIAAGPGNNGGQMALDGPTFVATEGWDWIPGVRDRNIGLWQPVELVETGAVRIGDAQVVTKLPLPNLGLAEVTITVPIHNDGATPVPTTVTASFKGVSVSKQVVAAPGAGEVRFAPTDFAQLRVANPQLWWPNGYGPQNLYTLNVVAAVDGQPSDQKSLRFGMREMSYGLSLFDSKGTLRRVEIEPTLAHERGEQLVALRHEDIKETPDGWAESLTPAGEISPAVRDIPKLMREPHLTIFVNGVPIAARGGNWGMDDFMKRISRARLEPYFRLHKEANVNIIRNWVGQNTEDSFFDLADEYGMLILNDFWESTQNFQNEAQDPQLFLKNAADVIARYRNHPSIAVWFGRNEGVPQPIINEGLDALVSKLDGTRYYTGSSNQIGLQNSGPYSWQNPVGYFTNLDTGFSVENGTPSLATLEAIKAMVPPADRWPISDTLAYHDWHIGGNGDVRSFMKILDVQLGQATSLEDFERKAQMLNYVDYRANFEGFNAHLWTKNSGRMLWMTHPAWPSNHWQIYSSDYDTSAAYYGTKAASEPIHVQMNLPDFALAVVNTTRMPANGLTLKAHVVDLTNRTLLDRSETVSAPANRTTTLPALAIQPLLNTDGLVLVELTLTGKDGAVVSRNFYWQGKDDSSYRRLNTLAAQTLTATARKSGVDTVIDIANAGAVPVLATKMTLVDAKGERVLPAFYDDNYINLLPGESRSITIRTMDGVKAAGKPAAVQVRGWNVQPSSVKID